MDFDFSVVQDALPSLMAGTWVTIKITFWGLFGGVLLGAITGVIRAYIPSLFCAETIRRNPVAGILGPLLSLIAQLYVLVVRGTPIVVQVMFIYFALPLLMDLRVDGMSAAIATLIINSGAYIAEIVRGALQSVPKGLFEAGQSMGLSFHRILLKIIWPVAFRRMIPALGNQCIISLKDSSLFIVIGVAELTRQGQEIMAANFRAVEIWGAVAVIYLILNGLIALALKIMEHRMRNV
ncbi:glutamine ABC transporter permease protein [Advenella kashmirensis WT001]|uniref:Glutamine ABC transporter permease protein n=1 Tax=Advenella kashmirensis (strain DSM 17095 / LMG 22695 / WT001) TaxID=1036672 RepID=I3U9H1_ADVKW|nr:glutamine ABC transporter permease GlnP [Advenella kashmirensis]AFK61659.1 glutamine ABC transporter permease protein [Advenella kashmirensis WT001]